MPSEVLRRFRLAYDISELFRRYFITTMFDSTFVVLGIVAATAILSDPDVRVTLGTLAAAVIAIGASTGVSVYEAERVEADIRMAKLERAMLSELSDTDLPKQLRLYRTLVSLVNFAAPLLVFALTTIPFFLSMFLGWPGARHAAYAAIVIAIIVVFAAGYLLGQVAGRSPVRQGLRMSVAAIATFVLLLGVQLLLR